MEVFQHTIRVYWEDTDAGGIVYYANYLNFFERARTEWLRSLGVHQQVLREEERVQLVVSQAHIQYFRPALLDDEIVISTEVKKLGKASILLEQKAQTKAKPDQILCQAEIKIGCIHAHTFAPCRFPTSLATTLPSL